MILGGAGRGVAGRGMARRGKGGASPIMIDDYPRVRHINTTQSYLKSEVIGNHKLLVYLNN